MACVSGASYVVQPGDTLYLIAQNKLGDGGLWPKIKNPDGSQPDANTLHPGQELCLLSSGGQGFSGTVSQELYHELFPKRNAFYAYDSLVAAAQHYPNFCNEGSSDDWKREAAAFFAHISHETGALVYVEEQITQDVYCDASSTRYPCVLGKSYHGRGPLQLSWNYNYGACGDAIGKDLRNHPELVATDSIISFTTALWFWMTIQKETSCHDAIRISGFGKTIDIINGGMECHKAQPTSEALDRVRLYWDYAGKLGVAPGDNLYC